MNEILMNALLRTRLYLNGAWAHRQNKNKQMSASNKSVENADHNQSRLAKLGDTQNIITSRAFLFTKTACFCLWVFKNWPIIGEYCNNCNDSNNSIGIYVKMIYWSSKPDLRTPPPCQHTLTHTFTLPNVVRAHVGTKSKSVWVFDSIASFEFVQHEHTQLWYFNNTSCLL